MPITLPGITGKSYRLHISSVKKNIFFFFFENFIFIYWIFYFFLKKKDSLCKSTTSSTTCCTASRLSSYRNNFTARTTFVASNNCTRTKRRSCALTIVIQDWRSWKVSRFLDHFTCQYIYIYIYIYTIFYIANFVQINASDDPKWRFLHWSMASNEKTRQQPSLPVRMGQGNLLAFGSSKQSSIAVATGACTNIRLAHNHQSCCNIHPSMLKVLKTTTIV